MRKGWWVPLTGAAILFAILAAAPAGPIGFFGAALWVVVLSVMSMRQLRSTAT